MRNTTSNRFPMLLRRIGMPLVGASAAAALLTISVSAGTGQTVLGVNTAAIRSCIAAGQLLGRDCSRQPGSGTTPRVVLPKVPTRQRAPLGNNLQIPATKRQAVSATTPAQQARLRAFLSQLGQRP